MSQYLWHNIVCMLYHCMKFSLKVFFHLWEWWISPSFQPLTPLSPVFIGIGDTIRQGSIRPRPLTFPLKSCSPLPLLLMAPWYHQVPRVPGVENKRDHKPQVSAKLFRFLPNFDLWMWKLKTRWKISSAYPVNEVPMYKINQHCVNIMQHLSKRRQNNQFKLNLNFTQFCCDFKFIKIYALFPSPWLGQFLSFPPLPSLSNQF